MRCTMAIRTNVDAVQAAIATIPDEVRQNVDYTCDGKAQVCRMHMLDRARNQASDAAHGRASDPSHRHRTAGTVA